jgi:hypothetical protein
MEERMKMIIAMTAAVVMAALPITAYGQAGADKGLSYMYRSERTAQKWSLLGTISPAFGGMFILASGAADGTDFTPAMASGGLVLTGLVIGPSMGYFYGDCPRRGLQGIGLRMAGLGLTITGIGTGMGWDIFGREDFSTSALVMVFSGAGLLMGSMVYDIATVKRAVRRRNEEYHGSSVSMSPVFFSETGGVGVSLNLTF